MSVFDTATLKIQANRCAFFSGQRVLLGKQKNNDLQWIVDWAKFFAAVHGTTAVLLYDNVSTRYSPSDLLSALAEVPGLERVAVVVWPYKFGPLGGAGNIWDSNFSEHGILEHARSRFLAEARSVVSVDVDELVITNGPSLHVLTERSATGYLWFDGMWVSGETDRSAERVRHSNYFMLREGTTRAEHKWSVVPSRCPVIAQWTVHTVAEMTPDPSSSGVHLRHFEAITTGWRGRPRLAQSSLTPDAELRAAFEIAF